MQVTETALKAAAASANEDCCPPMLKGEKKKPNKQLKTTWFFQST